MAFQDHLSQESLASLNHYPSPPPSQHHNTTTLFHHPSSPTTTPRTRSSNNPTPTWLNTSLLRHHFTTTTTNDTTTTTTDSSNSTQWVPPSHHHHHQQQHNIHSVKNDDVSETMIGEEMNNDNSNNSNNDWERERCKGDILNHPLYDQLLAAHVACLRIATPVDQLPRIDAQLAQSQNVVAKYSHHHHQQPPLDDKDLDHFMTHYVLLLSSFKEQLQQHVRVHAMEAVMACWELEQSLQSLTGVSPGEGTGATMSDDEDEQADSDSNFFDGNLDGLDSMGFGPLVPTESERSLMERVRQELKHELKQGYKEKIVDIREEILRKRRAGKLPGDTTHVLKAWWQSHSKWPYPTEEDKARLVQETGLQLKQINNWFINQRKRNWHSNPSSSSSQKGKRKNAGEKTGGGFM